MKSICMFVGALPLIICMGYCLIVIVMFSVQKIQKTINEKT